MPDVLAKNAASLSERKEMTYKTEETSVRKARLTVIIISVILILSICLFAACNFIPSLGSGEMQTKLEITSNIASTKAAGEDGTNPMGYDYVAKYLSYFGIGNFDGDKFVTVERYVQAYYYTELPAVDTVAYLTAETFLSQYYDAIDLKSKTAVTDTLLACYMRNIGDSYAYYRTPEEWQEFLGELNGEGETVVGIGVNVITNYSLNTILVNSTVAGAGAESAGILPGDYIIGADSLTTEKDGAEAVLNAIKGEEGTTVKIYVLRGTETLTFDIVRAKIQTQTSSIYYGYLDSETNEIVTDPSDVGYIIIVDFLGDSSSAGVNNTLRMFKDAVDTLVDNGVRGIVFDVRYNPGGLLDLVIDMVDYILPDGNTIVTETYRDGSGDRYIGDDGHSLDIPFVVLCNEYSASAAEIFASAVKDYASSEMGELVDASVVGNKTFGKGIVQSTWQLMDSSAITFTVAYYNPPLGKNFHGIGVTPNVYETEESRQIGAAVDELYRLIEDAGYTGGTNNAA